ncbi:MAG: hypothetical protein LBB75_06825 [Oscillospiraceae bacterium]|jgi:hypothetical protein|nr:hypothetical protein [Oscillospiraceae bacterium]
MKKKLLSLLLTSLLLLSTAPLVIPAHAFTGLVGIWTVAATPADYTPIYTPQDLDDIRNDLTGKYILMNDIDMSDWGEWKPIALDDEPREDGDYDGFSGVLDGNCFKISNLRCSGENAAGLMTRLIGKAVVKNLEFVNVKINAKYYAGGIAAIAMNESSTLNCSVSGSITTESDAGGIVGRALYGYSTRPTIRDCHNAAAITAPVAGGIVGGIYGDMGDICISDVVSKCSNSGKIAGEKTGNLVGSLVSSHPSQKWWQYLPVWVQWTLWYVCFGWIWM